MGVCEIRGARPEEQRQLTHLCVRATLQAGHDEAFIDRTMPALTITIPLINSGHVRVAEDAGNAVGVVWALPALQGIALLHGLFVDPQYWRRGIGRALFEAAIASSIGMKAGALMINAEPTSEGFYKRMGAVRIGEGPFYFSPETILPQLLYIIPREDK